MQTQKRPAGNGPIPESTTTTDCLESTDYDRAAAAAIEDTLLDAVFPEPPLPPIADIQELVIPHIFQARANGDGTQHELPWPGTQGWETATAAEQWAVVGLLALQGLWAAERGPEERVAYSEGAERVAMAVDWGEYSYRLGYADGRRDQKQTERRINAGIQRRRGDAA